MSFKLERKFRAQKKVLTMTVRVVRSMVRMGFPALLLGLELGVVGVVGVVGAAVLVPLFLGSPVLQLFVSHLEKEK